jgi:hypothetical protein
MGSTLRIDTFWRKGLSDVGVIDCNDEKGISMRRGWQWAFLLWVSGIVVSAADESTATPIYLFSGMDVRAKTKWGEAPIVSAGWLGLKAETTAGIKRFSYSGDFRLYPTTASDTQIVEVELFEVSLADARRNELEAQAMGDVQHYQIQTDIAVSDITRSGNNVSRAAQERIADLEDDYEEFAENIRSSIESGDYESGGLKDSVFLTLELLSPQEIDDAYGVVTIRYNVPNPNFPGGRRLLTLGRVRKIGDIRAGKTRKVKLSFRVPPGYLDEARYEFYLLSGAIP